MRCSWLPPSPPVWQKLQVAAGFARGATIAWEQRNRELGTEGVELQSDAGEKRARWRLWKDWPRCFVLSAAPGTAGR